MKRVVQYSVDILIENEEQNNINYEELIAKVLEEKGVWITSVAFSDDVTRHYEDYLKD